MFKQVKKLKKKFKLSKKEDKLSKFNRRNINKRLTRAKESNDNITKEKSNENITKEKEYMQTQLLEVQGNVVEVQGQFQKCKT